MVGRKRDSRLKRLLADYPAYHAPYPGPGDRLTVDQAEANLAYLLAAKGKRLEIAANLLHQFGLDLGAGLAAADPAVFFDNCGAGRSTNGPVCTIPASTQRSIFGCGARAMVRRSSIPC
jgi:hypothetical protein